MGSQVIGFGRKYCQKDQFCKVETVIKIWCRLVDVARFSKEVFFGILASTAQHFGYTQKTNGSN